MTDTIHSPPPSPATTAALERVSKEAYKAYADLPLVTAERDRLLEINAKLLTALKGMFSTYSDYGCKDLHDRVGVVIAETEKELDQSSITKKD